MKAYSLLSFALLGLATLIPEECRAWDQSSWAQKGGDETSRQLEFIAASEPPPGCAASAWFEQKDRILRRLTQQRPLAPNVVIRMLDIAESKNCEVFTRKYIIQYLQLYAMPRASNHERERILSFIRRDAQTSDSPSAGTALLALQRVSREDPAISEEEIVSAALGLLDDSVPNGGARGVAYRILAGSDHDRARAAVRNMDKQLHKSPMLRIAIDAQDCIGCEGRSK